MTTLGAILGGISAIYGLIKLIEHFFEKSNAQKAIDAIADVEKAIDKAKATNDTSDVEKMLNS